MNHRLDDDLATAQPRLSGDYVNVSSAQRDLAAAAELISGTFDQGGSQAPLTVRIDSYPQGGHECVVGQIAD